MSKEQIVPGLFHDPGAGREQPWAVVNKSEGRVHKFLQESCSRFYRGRTVIRGRAAISWPRQFPFRLVRGAQSAALPLDLNTPTEPEQPHRAIQ